MRILRRLAAAVCAAVMVGTPTAEAAGLHLQLVDVSAAKSRISEALIGLIASSEPSVRIPVYIFRDMLSDEEVAGLIASETSTGGSGKINLSLKTEEVLREMDDDSGKYLGLRRELVSKKYTEANEEFLKTQRISEKNVLYSSRYTSTVIVNATPAQILRYASSDDVEFVGIFDDAVQVSELDMIPEQINDGADGPSSEKYNDGAGYTGKGVIVGVIEAEGGRFDPDAPHLSKMPESRLKFVPTVRKDGSEVESVISDHATKVVSIIAGQPVTLAGREYRGIAPDATVYQTAVQSTQDVYYAFSMLADMGVNVINYSAGVVSPGYSEYDREIDRLVNSTGITFIKSAGNTGGDVTSPGKAANVITVGNLATKDEERKAISGPFSAHKTSAYEELDYLSEKPEVCAPGTNVVTVYDEKRISYGTGTSYAAPVVTGVVAQMMERAPAIVGDPCRVKSLAVSFCDGSAVSEEGNPLNGSFLREKTGAGLIDALQMVYGFTHVSGRMSKKGEQDDFRIELKAGQTVRIVLAQLKSNSRTLTKASRADNLDLTLTGADGKKAASSDSARNCVEIIEYTAPAAGTYTASVSTAAIADGTAGVPYGISWRILG